MSTAKRITAARDARGISKSELARRIGVSAATLTQWESGVTKTYDAANLGKAARELRVNEQWLLTGRGPRERGSANVEAGPEEVGPVPLISWVQAGTWNPAESPFTESEIDKVPCAKKHSPGAYALRVTGDSMTSYIPNTPSYPAGCIIFVDPELRSPHNGQHVIAKQVGEDEVTFKVFMQDGGRIWLRAINPNYEPIFDEFRILGTVIGKWEDSP